jgi:hypothetical protein
MAKHRKSSLKNSGAGTGTSNEPSTRGRRGASGSGSGVGTPETQQRILTLYEWLFIDPQGFRWMMACIVVGGALGFIVGAGVLFPGCNTCASNSWRFKLARSIRSTRPYQLVTFSGPVWEDWFNRFSEWVARVERDIEVADYLEKPAHPRVFAVLREAVVRENGGYLHPDLATMHPAPSGSVRGLGMVRDRYHKCQTTCYPGTEEEKRKVELRRAAEGNSTEQKDYAIYPQEEILIRIPLKFQMTRQLALDTLLTLIPAEVQRKAGMHELDDAALLVLYLAHERGVGKYSRWLPYIASLPPEPTCGYSRKLRPFMLNAIEAYKYELDVDTNGWAEELYKAMLYGERIAEALNEDYGSHLKSPNGVTSLENIQWSLCQVASRATAGSEKHGSLRMVPVLDLINHDADAGGFVELSGKERLEHGDFVDSTEDDSGTIVVRSLRHGRRKPLREGQELLVNYNVPYYTPLDWFVSLGFVPPERWGPWQKIDPVLPQVRRDGPFAEDTPPAGDLWKMKEAQLLHHLRNSEL